MSLHESTARTGWNDPASALAYDLQHIVAMGGPMARALLRALPPPESPVLELASGTGFFSAWLLDALGPGAVVIGCDAGRAVLAVAAAKRLPGLRLVEADAHRLPVRPGAFGAAYCSLGMHIFLEPGLVLQEMARAVRAGGGVAYGVPARGTLAEFWRAFGERAARPDLRGLVGPDGWAEIALRTTPDDAAEAAEHHARLLAAGLHQPRVQVSEEQLTFPDAGDLLERGGFGHFNRAVETISKESIRARIRDEVASMLDAQLRGRPLTVTIRSLVASGRVPDG